MKELGKTESTNVPSLYTVKIIFPSLFHRIIQFQNGLSAVVEEMLQPKITVFLSNCIDM